MTRTTRTDLFVRWTEPAQPLMTQLPLMRAMRSVTVTLGLLVLAATATAQTLVYEGVSVGFGAVISVMAMLFAAVGRIVVTAAEIPIVIYIMADELRYYESEFLGGRNIQTPNQS